MGQPTLMWRIREKLGDIFFNLFLWARGWTHDQYVEHIYAEVERSIREKENIA